MFYYFLFFIFVLFPLVSIDRKRKLLKREAGSGVRENEKMGTKQRTGNEVTDRAWVKVWFCSQFSFSRSPLPFSRFNNIHRKRDRNTEIYSSNSYGHIV